MGVLRGLTRTLSWVICQEKMRVSKVRLWGGHRQLVGLPGVENPHLLKRVGVEQNPAKLDDLGRILRDVDTVLITGRCNVHHDIAINVERRLLLLRRRLLSLLLRRRHDCGPFGRATTDEASK